MKIAKIIARCLAVPLILVTAYQTVMATIGLLAALSSAATTPRELGERLGFLTGTTVILVLLIVAFRGLGTKTRPSTSTPRAPA